MDTVKVQVDAAPTRPVNQWGAVETRNAIADGSIKAIEVLDAILAQIDRVDGDISAWVHIDAPGARKAADRIDAMVAAGESIGSLAGVSVGIKDIFNTAGMPCEMGSPIWKDFTPGNDARVVHYLRLAGAVFPGKTVTAEFAVHAPGPTHNPHRRNYIPGTSSSGSAAAVAAYMVPAAIGTQTAGSIIRPASYCGIYGFKPSFGVVPRTGMLKTTDTLDTVGCFARCVQDISTIFDVMRVRGLDFPILEQAFGDRQRQTRPLGRPWRVGLVRGPHWHSAAPETRQAVENFAALLGTIDGITIKDADLPASIADAHDVHATIYDRALAYYFKEEYQHHTLVSGNLYEIISRGNRLGLQDYRAALARQQEIARDMDCFLETEFDVLLDIATAGEAIEGLESVDAPDHALIWTFCHLPAASVPVLTGRTGLPLGAQFIARRYNDPLLLEFLAWLDRRDVLPRGTNPPPPSNFLSQIPNAKRESA